ncbi:MAG: hypothetical protein ABIH86_05940 [Planctomycetota bacterium]
MNSNPKNNDYIIALGALIALGIVLLTGALSAEVSLGLRLDGYPVVSLHGRSRLGLSLNYSPGRYEAYDVKRWVPERWDTVTRSHTVPGYWKIVDVPPKVIKRTLPTGYVSTVCISPGYQSRVWVGPVTTTTTERVLIPGHYVTVRTSRWVQGSCFIQPTLRISPWHRRHRR